MKSDERREYYRAAAEAWIEGVRLQAERCLGKRDGDARFDSNFLVVAIWRLREAARMAQQRAGVSELQTALEKFDSAHPEFRDVRDYQEHLLDPALIGTAMYFGGELVRLRPDMGAETLIDPAALLEDAEVLYDAICAELGPLPEPKDRWIVRAPDKPRR